MLYVTVEPCLHDDGLRITLTVNIYGMGCDVQARSSQCTQRSILTAGAVACIADGKLDSEVVLWIGRAIEQIIGALSDALDAPAMPFTIRERG